MLLQHNLSKKKQTNFNYSKEYGPELVFHNEWVKYTIYQFK